MGKAKRPFKLSEGRCADDKHVRITHDMLKHPSFAKLSSGAQIAYIYLRGFAKGKEKVLYAERMAELFTTRKAFRRARNELIEAGFIYWRNKPVASCLRNETGLYEFCDTWHTGKPRDVPD